MQLSVVIITFNEEANLGRTLASVQPLVSDGKGEIIVVDSGSTDRTVEIAKSFGAKVFVEAWKGFAAQKNSAIDRASGDWILSLDADEEVSSELATELGELLWMQPGQFVQKLTTRGSWTASIESKGDLHVTLDDQREGDLAGAEIPRKNFFLGRWIRRGGFYPDRKLRLLKKGCALFENRAVHEDAHTDGFTVRLNGALIHHSYPTLSDYIEHMNRYSSLGAEMVVAKGPVRFSVIHILLRPEFTFVYNYFFRLGFLDGREGLLLHLYHAVYVSWKYAKAWELSRAQDKLSS
ncbi:MAG TPA: glycosyltransferase family 2 protein [Candidatus Sulfotelmatobacter sp.]|jgi:glycosyltransferase involved in cell wall biosynthesis